MSTDLFRAGINYVKTVGRHWVYPLTVYVKLPVLAHCYSPELAFVKSAQFKHSQRH